MSLVNEKNIRELVQKDSISSKSKICYTLKYDEYLHIERQQVINRKKSRKHRQRKGMLYNIYIREYRKSDRFIIYI